MEAIAQMPQRQAAIENQTELQNLLFNHQAMEHLYRLAQSMAESKVTVPRHLQGSAADCMAICLQAAQWRMNPFAVAQKTHLVNGTLGYEAQLVNAVIQASGAITGAFKYEYHGDGDQLQCRVGAKLNGEDDVTWNEWLPIWQVTTKNSPLWKTNPKQQLAYLQVKNWARIYAPGAILGVYTADELQDYAPVERDITPPHSQPVDPQASQQPQALPAMPSEKFDNKLPAWKEQISSGQRTADDVIGTLTSRYSLTEQQSQALKEAEVTEQ